MMAIKRHDGCHGTVTGHTGCNPVRSHADNVHYVKLTVHDHRNFPGWWWLSCLAEGGPSLSESGPIHRCGTRFTETTTDSVSQSLTESSPLSCDWTSL
jgi:hypothetical protein